jgi:hypothetical protein
MRPCNISQHLKRPEIDRRLAAGEPVAQLARDYDLTVSSLHRHRTNCLKLGSSNDINKEAARGSARSRCCRRKKPSAVPMPSCRGASTRSSNKPSNRVHSILLSPVLIRSVRSLGAKSRRLQGGCHNFRRKLAPLFANVRPSGFDFQRLRWCTNSGQHPNWSRPQAAPIGQFCELRILRSISTGNAKVELDYDYR